MAPAGQKQQCCLHAPNLQAEHISHLRFHSCTEHSGGCSVSFCLDWCCANRHLAGAQQPHLHQPIIRPGDDAAATPVKGNAVHGKMVSPHCPLVVQLLCELLWRQQVPRGTHRGAPANLPEEILLQYRRHAVVWPQPACHMAGLLGWL